MAQSDNAGQAEFWNSGPGLNWVRLQADLDAIGSGVNDLLLVACAAEAGERVLDVGCGAGTSTFALADAIGPSGRALGVDISEPLLRRAEARRRELGLETVAFERADAQEHHFAAETFDLVASRFGLMFFADPVAALANIGGALRPGGRIAFAAWAAPERNPWFAVPQRLAVARLGPVAPTPAEAPGPTAFRDVARVCGLLEAAGFAECRGETVETVLHHPGGVEAVVALAPHVGPLARMMREKNGTPEDEAAILEGVAAEMEPFRSADGVRIPAVVNIFTARAG